MFQRGKLSWLIWNAVVAALLVVLGVLTCINSGESQFQSIIFASSDIKNVRDYDGNMSETKVAD